MWNKSESQNASVCLNSCITLVLCLFFGVGTCFGTAEMQKAFLDAQTIHDGWEANYAHIESVKFKLLHRLVHAEGSRTERLVRFSHYEKVKDGKRIYVRHTTSAAGFENEVGVIIMSFDGSIGKNYKPWLKEGGIYRGLSGATIEYKNPMEGYLLSEPIEIKVLKPVKSSSNVKDNSFIIKYLKLREKLKDKYPGGVPTFTYDFVMGRELGYVRVLPELESVAGQMCHVVEIVQDQDGPVRKYWFAHEKGMLPLRFFKNYENGNYTRKEVLKIASAETDVGEIWYPRVATRELKNGDRIFQHELIVYEFVPHIKVPPETFDIDFPDGTRVNDSIVNISYIKGGDPHIREPKLTEGMGIQPADATIMEDNLQDEPKPQTHEKLSEPPPNDANNSSVLGSTSEADKKQDTRNGPIGLLTPSLLIAVAVVAALVLCFGFSGRKFTGQ